MHGALPSSCMHGFAKGSDWQYLCQAAQDPDIRIPPLTVPLVYGMACSIQFLLPAAYWYAAHYAGQVDHFEAAVLAAINRSVPVCSTTSSSSRPCNLTFVAVHRAAHFQHCLQHGRSLHIDIQRLVVLCYKAICSPHRPVMLQQWWQQHGQGCTYWCPSWSHRRPVWSPRQTGEWAHWTSATTAASRKAGKRCIPAGVTL